MVNKYLIGILVLVLLTASVYILIPNNVRIDVGKTYSTFKVWENDSWVLAGQEYTLMFDGTTKMRASSRDVKHFVDGEVVKIIRTANFKDNVTVIDTYTFDGNEKDIELFPISHDINVVNGEGYILVYEVTKLEYFGETVKNLISPQEFGHNMKISWEVGNYYSRIWGYKDRDEGKLTVKYRPSSANYTKQVKLFDPPKDKYKVSFEFSKNSIIEKCLDIQIQNLQDTSDNLDLKTILNETNFEINKASNIKFYEWKSEEVLKNTYKTVCNPYNETSINGTYQVTNCTQIVTGNYTEEVWNWKDKQLTFTDKEGKTELRNTWEQVSIQQAGNKDTVKFKLCFDAPITETNSGWGNSGTIYLDLNGELFVDKTNSSWWNVSAESKRVLTINTNGLELNTNTTILVTIDSSNTSKWGASCNQSFMVYNDVTEIDKDVHNCTETNSSLRFKIQNTLNSSIDKNYSIYFMSSGNNTKNDLKSIYWTGDDFLGSTINKTYWNKEVWTGCTDMPVGQGIVNFSCDSNVNRCYIGANSLGDSFTSNVTVEFRAKLIPESPHQTQIMIGNVTHWSASDAYPASLGLPTTGINYDAARIINWLPSGSTQIDTFAPDSTWREYYYQWNNSITSMTMENGTSWTIDTNVPQGNLWLSFGTNYLATKQIDYFKVYKTGTGETVTIGEEESAVTDEEHPQFSNYRENPDNNTAYVIGATFRFNSTITHTNGTVGLDFNSVNYTAFNSTGNDFNTTISDLSAGTYTYYWWGYGNGTSELYNTSEERSYTIAEGPPTAYMWVSDSPIVNGLSKVADHGRIEIIYDLLGDGKFVAFTWDGNNYEVNPTGRYWNETGWVINNSLNDGLTVAGSGYSGYCSVFNLTEADQWTLLRVNQVASTLAWYWNGTGWTSDNSRSVGLPTTDNFGQCEIVQGVKDNNFSLYTQRSSTESYYWNGTSWLIDSSYKSGISGRSDGASIYYNLTGDNNWTYISDNVFSGTSWLGYSWNGTYWDSNDRYIRGIGTYGTSIFVPETFKNLYGNSNPFLIYGAMDGNFYGYNWSEVEINPDINYSVALPLGIIRFLNCSPDWENADSRPDGQTATIAAINATNNGTAIGNFTINLTGILNTGWTIWASNDSFLHNITLNTTAQTIWSGVAVDETKKIWLAANCSNVSANPGQSITLWVV